MKPISSRIQFGLVAMGYAAVLVVAAALLYKRHLVELQDPVAASGGMAAAGDTLLQLFIGCLFLIPTAFLIRIIAMQSLRPCMRHIHDSCSVSA
ncbi:MAG: hypothetical protein ABSB35_17005 [Bryobacteraceae bacterium]